MFITQLLSLLFSASASYSINVFPDPLPTNKELEYLNRMQNGDSEARAKLIEHNLRLVAHIVKKYDTNNKNTDDLISIGTIGLIKGIDSFKLEKNNKLTTYVARCIENEILMHFRSNKKNNQNVSLNDSIGYDKDGNEISLIDVIKSETPEINEVLHKRENLNLISNSLNCLNEREREIIINRFGLNDKKELTQKEIADKLNISRSYVSRIEKRAISKLYREFKKRNQEL
ncbi:MAG: RNA polymerase sporulation sigma factor SigK [Bacilli bacterium]|nr:RNA polymerase sporulation sigma factor SigK [Bacilli bacterium]